MSIRHYTPRRRSFGISQRSKVALGGALIATILLQMAYPLSDGGVLRFITIASVFMGAVAMSLHAYLLHGGKYLGLYLPLTLLFGYFIELCGVHTTWPFGEYTYDSSLGISIAGVPLIVPCAWVMMVHPALVAARRVTSKWTFLYGGAILATWDLFLDPQMVAAGRWHWVVDGPAFPFSPEIPLSNFFGWLLAGLTIVGALNKLLPFERRSESASLNAVVALLSWVLFSGLIGNLFFFDRPALAISASILFGALVAPFIFKSALGES